MFERLTPVIQQAAAAAGIQVPVLPDFPVMEPLNGQQPATPTLPVPQVPGPPLPAVSPMPPPPAAAPQPNGAPASAQRELHMDAAGRVLVSPSGAARVLLMNAGTTPVHASPPGRLSSSRMRESERFFGCARTADINPLSTTGVRAVSIPEAL